MASSSSHLTYLSIPKHRSLDKTLIITHLGASKLLPPTHFSIINYHTSYTYHLVFYIHHTHIDTFASSFPDDTLLCFCSHLTIEGIIYTWTSPKTQYTTHYISHIAHFTLPIYNTHFPSYTSLISSSYIYNTSYVLCNFYPLHILCLYNLFFFLHIIHIINLLFISSSIHHTLCATKYSTSSFEIY